MNEILLNNQVLVYLTSESILLFILAIAFFVTINILKSWDFDSYSQKQFALEKHAYLVTTILIFVFIVKIFTLIYFVFTINTLSVLIPGAMCGAGVISADDYGMYLLFFKLLILFFLLLWMTINRYDLKAKDYPLFHIKSWLFVLVFFMIVIEMWLNISYFTNIDTTKTVSCCSTIFGQLEGANPLPFGLDTSMLLLLFYLLFLILAGAMLTKQRVVVIVTDLLFVTIAYYAVVYFFGTYIYELPTHKCPFCMLHKEYHYVGYLIWGTLFSGVFLSISSSIMGIYLKSKKITQDNENEYRIPLILLNIFVLICTAYVAVYYLKNGVLL